MKRTVAAVAFLVSLAVSVLLVRECWTMPTAHDVATQTPEDILGLGYVLSWVVIAFVQAFLVAIAVWFTTERRKRIVAVTLLCMFVVGSVIGLFGYRRQMVIVLGTEDVSVAKALFF